MQKILTITLNPSIDLATSVDEFVAGRKLRCSVPRIDPGGGGVNVSRMIKALGGESKAVVAIAGAIGDYMRELLLVTGIDAVFLEAKGMTRQNIAIRNLTNGELFRFVLPGSSQGADFGNLALEKIEELISAEPYGYVIGSGSLPPGIPENFYAQAAEVANRNGSHFILDTSGPALKAAFGRGIFLIKTDLLESQILQEIIGQSIKEPERLAKAILQNHGAEIVIVTLGADGALLASAEEILRIPAPKVGVVSPVGAGDSFVAALSFALASGWSLKQAACYGVASAAAAVTTEATELAHKQDVDVLYADILRNITLSA